MSHFVLLLGFAVLKMVLAAAILWLGMRGGNPRDDDFPGDSEPPPGPPTLPQRRPRRARSDRGIPARRPLRRVPLARARA